MIAICLLSLGALAISPGSAPLPRPLCLQFRDDSERLEEARELLRAASEAECRSGAQICVELNSVASTRLLVEVLCMTGARGLAAAHYRDVCWEALRQITDPYAQDVVGVELEKNKKQEQVRQWCAELLGLYQDNKFAPQLIEALDDRHDRVRWSAARALGRLKAKSAQKALLKRAKHKHPMVRANSIEALALIDGAAHEVVYLKGLKDPDGGVRCALYATAPEAYPEQAEALSMQALADEDWRPRMQGLDNLASIRTKSAVDALLSALDDERPAVALRAIDSLGQLTHQKFTKRETWLRWWKEHRESFDMPEGRALPQRADADASSSGFSGIRLNSDHCAFLIDKSENMRQGLVSEDKTKDAAAHEELAKVLASFEDSLVFNLFCYALQVRTFGAKGSVELTRISARKALKFHADQPISGSKDIWQVLCAVLEDPELDTAYLLSSGEPDVGQYVHWNRITYQLQELNRFHKVVFHAIAYSDNEWHREQLEQIAKATGGEFKWFE